MVKEIRSGEHAGKKFTVYSLTNGQGMEATITNIGGAIMTLMVPDRQGNFADVALGFDTAEEYIDNRTFFGALVGRVANRVGGAAFELNGKTYHVTTTSGTLSLHGGKNGFDRVAWDSKIIQYEGSDALELTYISRDGEEGYPGNLTTRVIYFLTEDNSLGIRYIAVTDADTPINLTNHSYFNLKGHDGGDILDHMMWIDSKFFTPSDATLLPTGEVAKVEGTALDFTKMTRIGERIDNDEEPLKLAGGYDHNWLIDRKNGDGIIKIAEIVEPNSGRVMEVLSNKPAVQCYTGNFLKGAPGKGGTAYHSRNAVCMETQFSPNSVNIPHFGNGILHPGEIYDYTTIYRFSAK